MRGQENDQLQFLYHLNLDQMVPEAHPIRKIKAIAKRLLKSLDRHFDKIYSHTGRPSIPPERLLLSSLLIGLYSVPSDRRFCEELSWNMLFRWFLDMSPDERSFDHSTFTVNRERLMQGEITKRFFGATIRLANERSLISPDHFTGDGTLIAAWASFRSFQNKDPKKRRKDPENWHGEKRSNRTHASTTDPETRLCRKSSAHASILGYGLDVLMENRHGLLVGVQVETADGHHEGRALATLIGEARRLGLKVKSCGLDKGYFRSQIIKFLRRRHIKPHIAPIEGRKVAGYRPGIVKTQGYAMSQHCRKWVEKSIGWLKGVGGMGRVKLKGRRKNQETAYMRAATLNLLRMANLGVT